ncbi:glycosyltransferase family 4 protein [Candidatus Saccharibacteria bacterium]|nr:glycosyltransferase family 4 protein [Candidatus Saccharibacteria bacterium]
MTKVLIYKSKTDLKPIGGPNGYLYNLYDGIKATSHKDIDISFLPGKTSYPFPANILVEKLQKHKKLLFYICIQHLKRNKGNSSNTDFSKYDIIHFHSPVDFYVCRNKLKDFKGKIVLTCHSPMPSHIELVDYLGLKQADKIKKYRKMVEKVDIYAFNHADYILFPCEEAEECFYNTWDKYKSIKAQNKQKYFYIPTGLKPINLKDSQTELRKKYNLSSENIILSYVGRHNEVKGFKDLKKNGEVCLKEIPTASFLIAGEESPIAGLKHPRWREIGWTNKPHEIIKSSDIFVLPNKETYFDLILLEVLALGKPVVLTNTGGNKFFKQFKDSGLFFYEYGDSNRFVKIIKQLSRSDLTELGKKNLKIFQENFSSKIFAKKYLDFYRSIDENK